MPNPETPQGKDPSRQGDTPAQSTDAGQARLSEIDRLRQAEDQISEIIKDTYLQVQSSIYRTITPKYKLIDASTLPSKTCAEQVEKIVEHAQQAGAGKERIAFLEELRDRGIPPGEIIAIAEGVTARKASKEKR